ncbi:MAG: hypothetical protein NT003_04635 [Candidatus Magasanikbacteria bacterium]|nr:hypothetical protein [Candidatus Magasanikbacteria bacterium]
MRLFRSYIFCAALGALLLTPAIGNAQATKVISKKVSVVKKTVAKPKVKAAPAKKVVVLPAHKAQLLISSADSLRLAPGEKISVRYGFKNVEKTTWKTREIKYISSDSSLFGANAIKITTPLPGGRLEFYDISLTAPDQPGSYMISATLLIDGAMASGGSISLPIEVLNPESTADVSEKLLPQPRIRVALGKTEGAVSIHVSSGSYHVSQLDGTPIAILGIDDKCVIEYDQVGKTYLFTFNGTTSQSSQPFRLLADDPESRFLLADKSDGAKWNKSITYNEYRDSFELRWSDKIKGLWMINELPMEYYLRGLVETGNSERDELQKAVYTAARTYAYIYLPDGASHPDRLWDVHAVWDQMYKGYSAEKSNPNGVAALKETEGVLVTYQNKPVVTPYFTRSNGMTRGWKSVWGGTDKPWLKPVVAKYDAGKKMLGHGVGMSTQDAKFRVQKDGWTYEQVLTYYYTGVQLKKVYE